MIFLTEPNMHVDEDMQIWQLAWEKFSLFGSHSILRRWIDKGGQRPIPDSELLENVIKSDNHDACEVVLQRVGYNISEQIM